MRCRVFVVGPPFPNIQVRMCKAALLSRAWGLFYPAIACPGGVACGVCSPCPRGAAYAGCGAGPRGVGRPVCVALAVNVALPTGEGGTVAVEFSPTFAIGVHRSGQAWGLKVVGKLPALAMVGLVGDCDGELASGTCKIFVSSLTSGEDSSPSPDQPS